MTPSTYKQFISKPEISFWLPIVSTAIMLTLSYASFDKRMALLEQGQTEIQINQRILISEFRDWKNQAETRLGNVESAQNTVVSYLNGHLGVTIR